MNKIYRGISGVSGDMFQVQIFGSVDTPGPHGVSIAFRQLTLSRHRVPLKQKDTPGWESQPENFQADFYLFAGRRGGDRHVIVRHT